MLNAGDTIDNRTVCDLFRVANIGGIRVSKARNHIVLISNNTDPLYRNEWRDDVLHFVGRGTTGPQKLDRQNRTLANAEKSGAAIYLFEVFEKSRYVYAGEVELAGEPYMSDQDDARADSRFVWIFPLRRKPTTKNVKAVQDDADTPTTMDHLPHGAYAVIGSDMSDDQIDLVNRVLDQLKESGLTIFDKRDVDRQRYEKARAKWHEDVLDHARSIVRGLIAKKKGAAKAARGSTSVIDDELKINSGSNEHDLREALKLLDRDDMVSSEAIFEEARQSVPMPDVPKSLLLEVTADSIDEIGRPKAKVKTIDRKKFDDFT
jgi:Uri superfamily endonuclease